MKKKKKIIGQGGRNFRQQKLLRNFWDKLLWMTKWPTFHEELTFVNWPKSDITGLKVSRGWEKKLRKRATWPGKKRKMSEKVASTFPNEENQNIQRSKRAFQIWKVINFRKFGLNLRKPQNFLLPKGSGTSYIIILKTYYFRLPWVYLVSRV